VARFDRAIPPGGEGRITLKINTKGYRGEINKRAKVYTNDPKNRIVTLTIKALVMVTIRVSPVSVYFKGHEGQEITKTVQISAKEEKPLKLEPSHFNLSEKMTYRIEEIEAGRLFKVYFTNIPGPAITFRGVLKLKTNYPDKPEISISIRAKFQKKDAKAKGKANK